MTVVSSGVTEVAEAALPTNVSDASLRILASVNLTAGQRAQIWSIVRFAQNAGLPSTYVQQQIASLLTTQQFVSLHPELQRVYSGRAPEKTVASGQSSVTDGSLTYRSTGTEKSLELPTVAQPSENNADSKGVRGQISLGSEIAKIQLFNELASTA